MLDRKERKKKKKMDKKGIVAVTGATGFVGSFVCKALRDAGWKVRACVRDPNNKERVAHLAGLGVELVRGELLEARSFVEAFRGAVAVVHCAAVVEIGRVSDPARQVIAPSVEGVRNVLACVAEAGTVRVLVHTSSIAAVHRRGRGETVAHTESDWNDWATLGSDPYGVAKTEAERLVWEWHKTHGEVLVRVVNPTVVIGPVMSKTHTKSSAVFMREAVFNNSVAPFWASWVDVRDVAEAHVRALELPASEGAIHRFIVSSDAPSFQATRIGAMAQAQLPQYKLQTPPKYASWLVVLLVLLSYLPLVGRFVLTPLERSSLTWRERVSNAKAKKVLGMRFRPIEETVRDGVLSVIDQGFAKPKKR